MHRNLPFPATLLALAMASPTLWAADNAQLQQLQQEITALRKDYEAQLKALESRLRQAEASLAAQPFAAVAAAPAPSAAPSSPPAEAAPPASASPGPISPPVRKPGMRYCVGSLEKLA